MANYAINYEVYLGFSCMGGAVTEDVRATVDLSEEEVDQLLAHLEKFDLEKLNGVDFDNLRDNDITVDTLEIDADDLHLDSAAPAIYKKLCDANWEGYRDAGLEYPTPCRPIIPNQIAKLALFSKRKSRVLYHGSGNLFRHFDLVHALEGDGKCKFGFGIYLTSSFSSAAHYSGANPDWTSHYAYTVEIPELTLENTLHFSKEVPPAAVQNVSEILEEPIPEAKTLNGKDFRKHIAAVMYRRMARAAKKGGSPAPEKIEGEKAASEILLKAGIEYIAWPYNWRKPEAGLNIAVLDASKIKILYVQKFDLDPKKRPCYIRKISIP